MKQLFTLLSLLYSLLIFSQTQSILVYHETNGFRHQGAITNGITMFEGFGAANNFSVDNSQNANVFSASNLAQYDAVVFLNTSGNNLLSGTEQDAFEAFIASGKGFIGIHAATDTYRDGSWDFYNQLVGGIVQTGPNHTSNNFNADISVLASHPATDALVLDTNMKWNKNEEYYYWQNNGGQLSTDNTVLLEVEQTGSNSFDAARPITWFKESITYNDNGTNLTSAGFRSFYTALGHNGSDYSGNSNFRDMLENATLWAIGNTLSVEDVESVSEFKLTPNPTSGNTTIHFGDLSGKVDVEVFNILGKQILSKQIQTSALNNGAYQLDMAKSQSGVYLVSISTITKKQVIKFVKL